MAAPQSSGPPSLSRTTLTPAIFAPGVWPLVFQKYGKYTIGMTMLTRITIAVRKSKPIAPRITPRKAKHSTAPMITNTSMM